jgi:hypothetical protein
MDENLLPDIVDRKAARRERKQRFQAFAKDELDYYEQSKLVLEEEDDTFFEARECCDNCFFRIRISLCIFTFLAVCFIVVAGISGRDQDRLGNNTKLEIVFHKITNATYCNPTYGWKRDEKINPDCTVRNETTCDLDHFLYFPIGHFNSTLPSPPDCCQCLHSRWGPQCQFQCVGTINITNTIGKHEVPCNVSLFSKLFCATLPCAHFSHTRQSQSLHMLTKHHPPIHQHFITTEYIFFTDKSHLLTFLSYSSFCCRIMELAIQVHLALGSVIVTHSIGTSQVIASQ